MPLSDEDKKRIEEEEYRKHVQSQLQDTQRVDVNVKSDQRVETHGVGDKMYRDFKFILKWGAIAFGVFWGGAFLIAGILFLFGFYDK